MDVHSYMAERIPAINVGIGARFGGDFGGGRIPATLHDAMRHLLFPGGKRLRPIFAIAAAEAVGGSAADAMPIAVAVELTHTYSLIHDDLPCMDDDAIRRGQPTVHVAFDEATAVLAGDALLTEAFAALTASGASAAAPEAVLVAVQKLAHAAGARGLVGGQMDDLLFASGSSKSGTDHAELASIHARKTAMLFAAAIVGGAALAGATGAERSMLEDFAIDVGIAFQITDDLLDADSDEEASILRLQDSQDAMLGAEELLERALLRIEPLCERAEPLRELARFAVRRKR